MLCQLCSLSLSYEIGLKLTITDCIANCALSLSFEIGLILPISCQLWHFFPLQGYPYRSKIHYVIPPALSNRGGWIVCKLAHRKLCAILRNWIVAFIRILMLVTVIDVLGYAGPSLRLVVHCVGLPIALPFVLSLSLLWYWFEINYYQLRCQFCSLSLSFEIGSNLPIAPQSWHFFPSQRNPSRSKIHYVIPPAMSNWWQWIVRKLAHGKLCAILRNWILAFVGIIMLVTVIDVVGYTGPSLRLVVQCVGLLIALSIVLSLSLLWDWFEINYYQLRCQLCSLSLFWDWFDPTNCLLIVTFFPIARKPLPVQNPLRYSACLEQLMTMNCL